MNEKHKSNYLTVWGIIAVLIYCLITAGHARAAGTPAGTTISNTVVVNYQMSGVPQPTMTGFSNFVVDSISAITLVMNKTVTIIDQLGGNQPIPGATLRYSITVKANETTNDTANNVVITDPIPMNTVFIPNTLKLNDVALTDAADADAGDVGGTPADMVTVKLGNLTASSPIYTITFDVKIK